MRRVLVTVFGAVVALGVVALLGLLATQEDRDLNTAIVIDAPVAAVWRVLGDTAAYPEWNPLIRSLSGELRPGGRVRVTQSLPDGGATTYEATVLGYVPDHEIRWQHDLPLPRLFAGKRKLIIDALDDGRTRLRHEEEFRGLLVGPLTAGYIAGMRPGFEAMNKTLKQRVEGGG